MVKIHTGFRRRKCRSPTENFKILVPKKPDKKIERYVCLSFRLTMSSLSDADPDVLDVLDVFYVLGVEEEED